VTRPTAASPDPQAARPKPTPADPGYQDYGYDAWNSAVRYRFGTTVDRLGSLVFETAAADLFGVYLDGLPGFARQQHDCHCCRRFLEQYGGLVGIDDTGRAHSLFWDRDSRNPTYGPAERTLARAVESARVTGPFLSKERGWWGQPQTGPWTHFAVSPSKELVYLDPLKTAFQGMAEKKEDFRNLSRFLSEFPRPLVDQAVAVLQTDALYRSEKLLGQAQWLAWRHEALDRHGRRAPNADNLLWKAVAAAPAGFCHPRSGMIGTLLEDLAAGLPFEDVKKRFAEKMHPLRYQRPQALPAAGNVKRAEEIFAALGLAPALARRVATLNDVTALWVPTPARPLAAATPGPVFGAVPTKGAAPPAPAAVGGVVPVHPMSFEKFRREVLPAADRIEMFVPPGHLPFVVLVTAIHWDAPPLLQWDLPDRRNPVSWYFWNGGSPAHQFGLSGGSWVEVPAVCLKPSMWGPDEAAFAHHGQGAFFLLAGARETRAGAGLGLFPEFLRAELREVRATIEAYARRTPMAGLREGSAVGLGFHAGKPWTSCRLRVVRDRTVYEHVLDRWD
jgi:hypothetical protein